MASGGAIIRVLHGVMIALAIVCALVIDFLGILRDRLARPDYVTDFAVFWRAAQVDPKVVYDIDAITKAQATVIGAGDFGPRPFVNPPSMLPLMEPFAALPYWPSLALWWGLGLLAFVAATRSLLTWRRALVIAIAPTFVLTFVAGQVSLFVGALVAASVLCVRTRPIVAGLLLGFAATIKPQTVVLAPIAFAAGGHWRALGSAFVTGALIGVTCLVFQGPQLWLDWIAVLHEFGKIAKGFYFTNRGVTPTSLAFQLGLSGFPADVLIWGCRLLAVAVAATTFRFSKDAMVRLVGLVGAGLLVSPYALPPETVVLLVPASCWLLSRDHRGWPAGFLLISHLVLPVGVIVSTATACWLAISPLREERA